jgi:hypothetical protein
MQGRKEGRLVANIFSFFKNYMQLYLLITRYVKYMIFKYMTEDNTFLQTWDQTHDTPIPSNWEHKIL